MSDERQNGRNRPAANSVFPPTSWTLILNAGGPDSSSKQDALGHLFSIYRNPIYVFARRLGLSHDDAEDAIQSFFLVLVEKDLVAGAEASKGRFRNFLSTCFHHHVIQTWKKKHTQKRGGNHEHVEFDDADHLGAAVAAASDGKTPAESYDHACAVALFESALAEMAGEWAKRGKPGPFAILKPILTLEEGKIPIAELARRLNVSEGTAKAQAFHFRKQFGEILRRLVLETLVNPLDLEDELQHLKRMLLD